MVIKELWWRPEPGRAAGQEPVSTRTRSTGLSGESFEGVPRSPNLDPTNSVSDQGEANVTNERSELHTKRAFALPVVRGTTDDICREISQTPQTRAR